MNDQAYNLGFSFTAELNDTEGSMINQAYPPIFDGHNDVLSRLFRAQSKDKAGLFRQGNGHIDVERSKLSGFHGGFFAIWISAPPSKSTKQFRYEDMAKAVYDIPLPDPIDRRDALDVATKEAAILLELDRQGLLTICKTANEIEQAIERGEIAAIFHMEGAEAIGPDFRELDLFHAAGLRSIGPVWSRPTIFGHGVPFRYPGGPDTGDGLTDLGKELVRYCNARRILIDLSHLNEKGFWDVAKTSNAPLVATHSNCHAICRVPRNLTDKQLHAIAASDGMVGLNFAVAFLRDDGRMNADTPLSDLLRHLDHLLKICGEDRVGFGSDFDGAIVPRELGDVSGLPVLRKAMREHGYGEELVEKICFRNWLRVLKKTWGA